MKIMKRFAEKSAGLLDHKCPTIAFLGDSVTQGCFELYETAPGSYETVFDQNGAYHQHLFQILQTLYPNVPVNIVNAGISGDSAPSGYRRLRRDVLDYNPDLVVVCFGLNDSQSGLERLHFYTDALRSIFTDLKQAGVEVIFMTANMMNTYVSCHLREEIFKNVAANTMKSQNDGVLTAYFQAGARVAEECGVPVCDAYRKWMRLAENGVDVTSLLSNYINHPTREMNWLFAVSLFETMLEAE